jgi:hypothetical protein
MATTTLTVTCAGCRMPWQDGHRCTVPPQVDTGRYTTGALGQLADYLTRVVADRRRQESGVA